MQWRLVTFAIMLSLSLVVAIHPAEAACTAEGEWCYEFVEINPSREEVLVGDQLEWNVGIMPGGTETDGIAEIHLTVSNQGKEVYSDFVSEATKNGLIDMVQFSFTPSSTGQYSALFEITPPERRNNHVFDSQATYFTVKGESDGSDSPILDADYPYAKDENGEKINDSRIGQTITLSAMRHNNSDEKQSQITIIEIRDSENTTVFLQIKEDVLEPGSHTETNTSWIPDQAGKYEIRSFLISNFVNPSHITPVRTSSLTVIA